MPYSWQLLWLATFVLAIALFASAADGLGLLSFALDHDSVTGTVVARMPEIHDSMRVEYSVNGNLASLTSSAGGGASAHQIGDRVTVYYSHSDPRFANLRQPSEVVGDAVIVVTIIGVVVASWLTYVVEWYRRRGRRL